MKRATILIILLVVTTTNLSCCRGLRSWGNRGAPCQPQYAQPQWVQPQAFAAPQAMPYTTVPQAAPVYVCPPVDCVPTTVCPPDPCISMDYGSSSLGQPVPAQPQPAAGAFDGVYFPGDASSSMVHYSKPTLDQAVSPLQPLSSLSPSR